MVWSDNLPADVARVTNGHKADAIYDGMGRETFAASFDSLHKLALLGRPPGRLLALVLH
jgi:NADPH:quinone reductase